MRGGRESVVEPSSPLGAVLVVTFLASIATGVVWTGIPFIAQSHYHYSQRQNLLLSLFMGAVYVLGAMFAGRITASVQRVLSPRGLLAHVLVVQAISCLGPALLDDDSVLWLVGGINSVLASLLWPLIESYLTSGRHGRQMRSAIGHWNLVWTSAVAVSMLLMAPLLKHNAPMAIIGLGAVNLAAALVLPWFARRPGAHDEAMSQAAIEPDYPLLLRSARMLLPLSYLLNAAMTPILPHRLTALGVDSFRIEAWNMDVSWQTPATATWMALRVLTMAIMWRIGFWHGRWGTLLLGGMAMTSGFAMVVVGPSVAVVLAGFGIYGVGMGIVYYATLYYSMSVGRAEVAAAGAFEALIGLGYTIGPLAALVGLDVIGAHADVPPDVGITIVVCLLVALGAIPAAKPYLTARRARAHARS